MVLKAKDVPCAECGHRWPEYLMQFDHLPGCIKVAAVSTMVSRLFPQCQIAEEITKCEVVCVNCHTMRTRTRGLFRTTSIPLVTVQEDGRTRPVVLPPSLMADPGYEREKEFPRGTALLPGNPYEEPSPEFNRAFRKLRATGVALRPELASSIVQP
jgi:hypothetical protein